MAGLERQKILAIAQRLQTFTVELLASTAQVSRDNVYQVLGRDQAYFEKAEAKRGERGRPVILWRVVPAQAEALAQEITAFQKQTEWTEGFIRASAVSAKVEEQRREKVTADLIAAEYLMFQQFPREERPAEQEHLLQKAYTHLAMDHQSVSGFSSPRRKVGQALFQLCLNELQARQAAIAPTEVAALAPQFLYQDLKTKQVLEAIVAELPKLTVDFQKAVTARLEKSPMLKEPATLPGLFMPSFEPMMGQLSSAMLNLFEPSSGAGNKKYCPRIEFLTTDKYDATLTQLAHDLESEVKTSGVPLTIHEYAGGQEMPLDQLVVTIIGCNSAGDPAPPKLADLEKKLKQWHTHFLYCLDVNFRADIRDQITHMGGCYLPNVQTMNMQSILEGMRPLADILRGVKTVQNVVAGAFSALKGRIG